jgi:hypothetical protein
MAPADWISGKQFDRIGTAVREIVTRTARFAGPPRRTPERNSVIRETRAR